MKIAGGLSLANLALIRDLAERCFYCDCELRENRTIDHMEPIALGGSNDEDNIVVACRPCNEAKGMKSFVEWMDQLPAHHRKRITSRAA
jgi:5-methylcytosine-specific restriction endonuclease McrA